jgi:hypothetical protein
MKYNIKIFIKKIQKIFKYGLKDLIWIPVNFFKINEKNNLNFNKLTKYKDIHKNKVCLLVGNGPSVDLDELESIKGNEVVTFCANRFFLAYKDTSFKPTYTVTADSQMIKDFGLEIIDKSKTPTFIVSETFPNFKKNFLWVKLFNGPFFWFSSDIRFGINIGAGTLIAAMQIGYFMGIRKFYLYGVDHNFKFKSTSGFGASGDGNHFIKNYRSNKEWQPPKYEYVERALSKSDKFLRKRGGFIINCTNGGKLDTLKRRDFYEVFK